MIMKGLMFLPFVAMTFVCWGLYGPTLHVGQEAFGADGQRSAFRPFICVGLAYFLVAVIVPTIVLRMRGEVGHWTAKGTIWSFGAGVIGAIGALGIVLALKFGGDPIYVMPLVFGLAPVVNMIMTMIMAGNIKEASWPFFVGIVVVGVGAAGVLVNRPSPPKPAPGTSWQVPNWDLAADLADEQRLPGSSHRGAPVAMLDIADDALTAVGPAVGPMGSSGSQGRVAVSTSTATSTAPLVARPVRDDVVADPASERSRLATMVLRGLFILMTALCWGSYGPVLHKGQVVMGGSRMRPFICVGLAYFAVAVVLPLIIQPAFTAELGSWWAISGWFWSLLAGTFGALGALGIIYAFNFGGRPIFVMPLVFGGAPVVNTISEIISKNLWGQISSLFYLSLFLVIAGAVTVLTTAPKPLPKVPPK